MKIILKPTLDSSKLASASPTSNPIILMKQQSRFRVARRTIMMHRKGVLNMSWERKRLSKMDLDLIVFVVQLLRGLFRNGRRFRRGGYII